MQRDRQQDVIEQFRIAANCHRDFSTSLSVRTDRESVHSLSSSPGRHSTACYWLPTDFEADRCPVIKQTAAGVEPGLVVETIPIGIC